MRKTKTSNFISLSEDVVRQKVLNYAYLLLKIRPRSEKELVEKLSLYLHKHNMSEEKDSSLISPIIEKLKRSGFVNDQAFVQYWIEKRFRGKPKGKYIIVPELVKKGIDKETIERELSKLQSDYPEDTLILSLVTKAESKYKELTGYKLKEKIIHYVVSRGFSYNQVRRVIDERTKKT